MIALLRPNAKEKAKNETYLNENVVISGNIVQLPGECNLCNVSEQAWFWFGNFQLHFTLQSILYFRTGGGVHFNSTPNYLLLVSEIDKVCIDKGECGEHCTSR